MALTLWHPQRRLGGMCHYLLPERGGATTVGLDGRYGTEAIDLLQLHCPPTEAFYLPEVFDGREALVQAGKLRHDGVGARSLRSSREG